MKNTAIHLSFTQRDRKYQSDLSRAPVKKASKETQSCVRHITILIVPLLIDGDAFLLQGPFIGELQQRDFLAAEQTDGESFLKQLVRRDDGSNAFDKSANVRPDFVRILLRLLAALDLCLVLAVELEQGDSYTEENLVALHQEDIQDPDHMAERQVTQNPTLPVRVHLEHILGCGHNEFVGTCAVFVGQVSKRHAARLITKESLV